MFKALPGYPGKAFFCWHSCAPLVVLAGRIEIGNPTFSCKRNQLSVARGSFKIDE